MQNPMPKAVPMIQTAMGFWTIARESPEKLCLVDPEGVEVTYGELLERSNRLVHGLRALGLQPGDGVAIVLPNGSEFYALFFAAMQAGWYFTPINCHLVGPEIAYIVDDSETKALIVARALRRAVRGRGEEIALPPERRFAIGDVDGFRPFDELIAGQPATAAGRPHGRRAHALHLGHDRASRRACAGRCPASTPTQPVTSPGSCCSCSASSPTTTTSTSAARRCTTRPSCCSRPRRCTSATRSCSWTSGRRGAMLQLIAGPQGDPQPHGPDAVQPPAAAARGGARRATTCRRCAT